MAVFKLIASNSICFSYRKVFQNGVNTLSEMVNHFCQKAQNFVGLYFGPYDLFCVILASTYGPGSCGPEPYGSGPLGPYGPVPFII